MADVEDTTTAILKGAPWWAKLISVFGGPTFILILVLYGFWSFISNIGERMVTTLTVSQQSLMKHVSDTDNLIDIQRQLVIIVRANCYNNARDDAGRERCMK
jgi:hypothetical protein